MGTSKSQKNALAEFEKQRSSYWDYFKGKLESLDDFVEAELFARVQAPSPGSPGRQFHSNLSFFLQSFSIPGESSQRERVLYLQFVRKLSAAGILKSGAMKQIEAHFSSAGEGRY